jgi:hypothetical protein
MSSQFFQLCVECINRIGPPERNLHLEFVDGGRQLVPFFLGDAALAADLLFEMVQGVAQRLLLAVDALLRLPPGGSQLRVEGLRLSLERVEHGVE